MDMISTPASSPSNPYLYANFVPVDEMCLVLELKLWTKCSQSSRTLLEVLANESIAKLVSEDDELREVVFMFVNPANIMAFKATINTVGGLDIYRPMKHHTWASCSAVTRTPIHRLTEETVIELISSHKVSYPYLSYEGDRRSLETVVHEMASKATNSEKFRSLEEHLAQGIGEPSLVENLNDRENSQAIEAVEKSDFKEEIFHLA
jgi:hypothetical protein